MPFVSRVLRRTRTIAIVLLALFAAYVLAGLFLAPGLMRRTLVNKTDQLLHLRPSLREVKVNPLALSVTFGGFQLDGYDGSPLVGFAEFYVNFSTRKQCPRAPR